MIEALRQSLEARPTSSSDSVPKREHDSLLQDYYDVRDQRDRAESEVDEMARTISDLREDLDDERRRPTNNAELDEARQIIADLRGQLSRERSVSQRDTRRYEVAMAQMRDEVERVQRRADWNELKTEHMRRRLAALNQPPSPRPGDMAREPTEDDIRRIRPHRDMPQADLDRAVLHGEIARDVYHEDDEFNLSDNDAPPSSDVDSEGRPKVRKGWLKKQKAKAREAKMAKAAQAAGPSTRLTSPPRAMDVDGPPPSRPPSNRRGAGRGATPSRVAPTPYHRHPRIGDRLEDRLAQRAQSWSLARRSDPSSGPSSSLEDRLGAREMTTAPPSPPLHPSEHSLPAPSSSLLHRVAQPLPARPAAVLPFRGNIPGGEYPLPSDNEIRRSYYSEAHGPLTDRYDAFRVVYGRLLDLRRHFPAVPPTTNMINPLTGRAWTLAEIHDYPRGYPGWPSNSPSGDVMSEAERIGFPVGTGVTSASGGRDAIRRSDRHLVALFDRTNEQLAWMRSDAPGNVEGYRWPNNEEEARLFRDIAHRACNVRANALWGRYRDLANNTARPFRTPALTFATDTSTARPTWAEYRKPKTRRRAPVTSGEVTLDYGPPQQPPQPPQEEEMRDDHPVPSSTVLPMVDVDNVAEWQVILRDYPGLLLPGILRAEDGSTNTVVLRGLLHAATTGPVNVEPSGRAFVAYSNLLAEAIRQLPELTPNQLMGFEYFGPLELPALVETLQARMTDWVEHIEVDEFTGRLEHLASVEAWVLTLRANPPGEEVGVPSSGLS